MSKLIILNLADPKGIGPIARVKTGLQGKQNTRASISVGDEIVPIYDLLDEFATASSLKMSDELKVAALACEQANKIYLCTHGLANDTEHALAKASGGGALGIWEEFGKLLGKLLLSTSSRKDIGPCTVLRAAGAGGSNRNATMLLELILRISPTPPMSLSNGSGSA